MPQTSGPAVLSKTQSFDMNVISTSTSWRFQPSRKNASRNLLVSMVSPPRVRVLHAGRPVNSPYIYMGLAGGTMYGVGAGGIPIHPSAGPLSHDM